MTRRLLNTGLAAAFAVFVAASVAVPAEAGDSDYRLAIAPDRLPIGQEVTLDLRLLHATTGKVVPDAVIFRTRLDMSPDGMGDMVEPLTPLPSPEPGVWRFATRLSMAGGWLLSLQAKVPGETATVRETFVLTGFEPATASGGKDAAKPGAGVGGAHSHGH